jgi:predicted PurR-regulated permease PerM
MAGSRRREQWTLITASLVILAAVAIAFILWFTRGAVQMIIGNILEPRIMGEGVGLHPIVILFALAFWGLLWGPVGAILAVPITAVVRIAISRFESLKLVTDLMAGTLPGQRGDGTNDGASV